MFCKRIWCLLVVCGYVGCSTVPARSTPSPEYYPNIRRFYDEVSHRTPEAESKYGNRVKRGIVMVDEDFDVPPGHNGVGESDGIFDEVEFEKILDGSGDETVEISSKVITESFTTVKYTKFETEHRDITNKTTSTQFVRETTEPIQVESSRTSTFTPEIAISESDGSGDGMTETQHSTTETITEINFEIEDVCLNSTCSLNDLSIQLSEDTNVIPEGTNLTFSCSSNNSVENNLYWYKSNGSTYFLQISGEGQKLHFNVPDAKAFHSGTYKCVKRITNGFCCNTESYVTVYEVPLYKYHIIILALVAAVGLLICIFLSVRQTVSFKTYSEQFAKKHGSLNQALL